MMIDVLISVLAVTLMVLSVLLYRAHAEVKRLTRKLDDIRIHEWNLADASEKQKSHVRHDLKGFLNRIQGLAGLIRLSDIPLSKDQEEQLEMIERQCQEGKDEIDRVLPKDEQ